MNSESHKQRGDDKPEDKPTTPSHKFVSRLTYKGIVDQRIAEAEAKGHFRNLPGAGKPLKLDDDANVPEEDRAAFRMLKNAGFAPPWIELQKTIFDDQARLDTWLTRANERWSVCGPLERQRLRDEFAGKLRELARLIEHYNLTIPTGVRQMPGLRLDEELKRLGS